MIHKIAVHFDNCASIIFHYDIDDIKQWCEEFIKKPFLLTQDCKSGRSILLQTKFITGLIIDEEDIHDQRTCIDDYRSDRPSDA